MACLRQKGKRHTKEVLQLHLASEDKAVPAFPKVWSLISLKSRREHDSAQYQQRTSPMRAMELTVKPHKPILGNKNWPVITVKPRCALG